MHPTRSSPSRIAGRIRAPTGTAPGLYGRVERVTIARALAAFVHDPRARAGKAPHAAQPALPGGTAPRASIDAWVNEGGALGTDGR